jgi:hypothetical protein
MKYLLYPKQVLLKSIDVLKAEKTELQKRLELYHYKGETLKIPV